MDDLLKRLVEIERMDVSKFTSAPIRSTAVEARLEIEDLREALFSVRGEVDLRKAPKLMAKIEAALRINR